jgi:hypothetical protein
MIMNWRLSVAAVAVLIALGGTAEADVLTAGPVYAGSGQLNGRVFCWLFNTGTTNATISSREIWSSIKLPASVALTGDSCNTVLMPGRSCQFFAGTGTGTYTCRANTNGIDNRISGTMQLYNSADVLLVTIPMAK